MPYYEHTATIKPRNPAHETRRTRGAGGVQLAGCEYPDNVSVFWSIDENRKGEPVEIRFPVSDWTEESARSWLVNNRVKYDIFSPAEPVDESEPCYNFAVNAAGDTLDIDIHGIIGDEYEENDSRSFKKKLDAAGDVKTINVDINSPGGSHFAAMSIHNSLYDHPANVITKVSGIAASAAASIFAAGDERIAPSNTSLMVHKPMVPIMIGANADKMREQAEFLDKIQNGIVETLARVIDKNEEEIDKMLNATTWLTAKEAADIGFVSEVSNRVDVVNFHDFSKLDYSVPDSVLNAFDVNHGEADIDIVVDELGDTGIDKIINLIKSTFTPKVKETDTMSKETENQIADLVTKVDTLIANREEDAKKITALETENASQSATIEQLNTALSNQAAETQNNGHREFCENLVKQGRMFPAHVDCHVKTLAMKLELDEKNFTAENTDTPEFNAYKEMLEALPVVVPVEDRHVANKKDAKKKTVWTEAAVEKAINKIVEEKKLSIKEATALFSEENPDADFDID